MPIRKDIAGLIAARKAKQVPGIVKRGPKSDTEAVIQHLLAGELKLTPQQEALVERITFVDKLVRGRKHTSDMIMEEVMARFSVSAKRARQDLYDCHKVFGETRKLNKAYLMGHHIEQITLQIQTCLDAGGPELDKEGKPTGRRIDQLEYMPFLAKLNDNLTYALNSLPAENDFRDTPPVQINFTFNGTAPMEKGDLEDALASADRLIIPNNDHEFIDYEEDRNGTEPAPDDGADDPGE